MEYLFEKLTQNIKNHNNIVLMTHKRPDLDGMGSCIALSKIIESMKKEVYIVYPEEQVNVSLEKGIKAISDKGIKINFLTACKIFEKINNDTLLIVLDTQTPELVENAELLDKIKDIFVIDHHMNSSSHIEKAIFEYINSNKSSIVEIITGYLKYLNKRLDPIIITIMLAGMEIDTNGYNLKTSENTFKTAAYLTKKGADSIIKQEILKGSREDFIRRHNCIKNSYYIKDKYLLCEMPDEIYDSVDLAIVADEMLRFEDVDVSFIIGRIKENIVGVSARSLGNISVGTIMSSIGGGGNVTDAAAQIPDKTIKEVVEMIKKAIEE